MSKLLVCCGPQAHAQLKQLLPHLPNDEQPVELQIKHMPQLAIAVGGGDCGISHEQGVMLAFEGYVTHTQASGDALRLALIEDYLKLGEHCAKQWHGSFRVVIFHQGITRIYTDQVGSRALFFVSDDSDRLYCSHSAPLLAAMKQRNIARTIDGANLLQFMNKGRFFAGGSLFKELRQMPPGTGHRIIDGQTDQPPQAFTWYQYQLHNLNLQANEVLPELKNRLDRVILQHWQRANSPMIILSGGVDSRYILNTLGELLPTDEFKKVFTCLWSEPNPVPDSDADWAMREAARHQVPFELFPINTPNESLFERLFALQSGMTAQAFIQCNDLHHYRHLAKRGLRSLIRGDETFGPNGQAVNTSEEALAKAGLGYLPQGSSPIIDGFNGDINDWREAHTAHTQALAQVADAPNDVRDILYCRERLPALITHLSAHRAPFVESFNPLLDPDILDLVGQLPSHMRTDKSIFRQCFARYYPTEGFATSGNAFDWQRLWHDRTLAAFVQQQLAQLPAPFNSAYWHKIGQLLSSGNEHHATSKVPVLQIACRAIVIGQWLNG